MFESFHNSLEPASKYFLSVFQNGLLDELSNRDEEIDLEKIEKQFHIHILELVRKFNQLSSSIELTKAREEVAAFTIKFYPQLKQFTEFPSDKFEYARYLCQHLTRDGECYAKARSITISEWARIIEKSFELKLEQLITPALLSQ